MKKYFAYTRVSTVKQGEKGVSLQEQRYAIENYAKRNDLVIASWYEEKETAAKRGRPYFNQMIRLLKQGKADGVIIHKIDRSARNLKDWADLGELIDQGIEVHFANESLDLNTRGGRLSADIQAVIAADYIRNLREEIKKGFNGRIKQGLYPWPAPIGYVNTGGGKPKEPDPIKAPLIKRVFELYATGRYNLEGLAEEMYRLGLRNRNGKKVTINGLSIILNNPFYMGLIRLKNSGEIFPGIHQPIINKSLFDRVQAVLSGKFNGKVQRHDFLFRRLLSCQHCGYSLIGEMQKGYTYYRCHTRLCPTACIREEVIENKVIEKFSLIQFSEEELSYLKLKVAQLKEDWKTKKEAQITALSLHLNQIQERINRLTDAYIDRMIEKELFEERKTHLLMEKKSLEEKLAELRDNQRSVPDRLSKFLELAGNVYLSYKSAILEEKRDLLKIVTSNRLIDGKNIELMLTLPFQEVANRHNFSYGGAKRDRPRTVLDRLFERLYQYFTSEIKILQE